MPCSPAKARLLLKQGKAKVVRRDPFTIQLLYGSSGYRQYGDAGQDAGYKHAAVSVTTAGKELLSIEAEVRTDVPKRLAKRREQRSARRSRKTRHRECRIDNRANSMEKGRLTPSQEGRIEAHLYLLKLAASLVPIRSVNIEGGPFDIAKLKNPDIHGIEYCNGEQKGSPNVKAYVKWRDGYECQICHGKSGDRYLQPHHIESRLTGGDAPNNLVTMCETCHKAYHAKKVRVSLKRGKSYRDAAAMNTIYKRLVEQAQELFPGIPVTMTFGYVTAEARKRAGLEKSHRNDAFCIAGNLDAERCDTFLQMRKVRRHNRQIHAEQFSKGGVRKLKSAPYEIFGFRMYDKVRVEGQEMFIIGRRKSGIFVLQDLDGNRIQRTYRKLEPLSKRTGWLYEIKKA